MPVARVGQQRVVRAIRVGSGYGTGADNNAEAGSMRTISEGGCGCQTPETRPTRVGGVVSMLLGLGLLAHRRQRRC